MQPKTLMVMVITCWVAIIGDCLLKTEGKKPDPNMGYCALAAAIYAATAVGWFYILREMKMAVIVGTIYPLIQGLTCIFVGYFLYDEKLSPLQAAGIFLAIIGTAMAGE